jgi:plastocyanin
MSGNRRMPGNVRMSVVVAFASNVVILLTIMGMAAGPARATRHDVTMTTSRFVPDAVQAAPGDSVVWTNTAAIQHTVTSGTSCTANGEFNSGTMNPSQTFVRVFTSEGSFPYFCTFHCAFGMIGSVTVAPTPNDPRTWGKIKTLYR